MAQKYYIVVDEERRGPFSLDELANQGLHRETLVWCKGMKDWTEADRVPELADLLDNSPPPFLRRRRRDDPSWRGRPNWEEEEDGYYRSRHRPRYQPSTFRRLYRAALICYVIGWLVLPVGIGFGVAAAVTDTYRWETNPVTRRQEVRYDRRAAQAQETYIILAVIGFVLALIPLLVSHILFVILLYKCWNVIQDGRASASPGQAVGFLFIPFFNLYWIFVAYRGLAVDMNRYADRHQIDMPPAPEGLGLTYCILGLLGIIPYAGVLASLAAAIVYPFFMNAVKNGAIAIVQAEEA